MTAVYNGIIVRIYDHIGNIISARHIQRFFSRKLHAGGIKRISVPVVFIQKAVNFTVHIDIVHFFNNFLKSILQIIPDCISKIFKLIKLFLFFRIKQNIQDNAVSQNQRYDHAENINDKQLFSDIKVIHKVFKLSPVSAHALPQSGI